jgi:hypothetical protein
LIKKGLDQKYKYFPPRDTATLTASFLSTQGMWCRDFYVFLGFYHYNIILKSLSEYYVMNAMERLIMSFDIKPEIDKTAFIAPGAHIRNEFKLFRIMLVL